MTRTTDTQLPLACGGRGRRRTTAVGTIVVAVLSSLGGHMPASAQDGNPFVTGQPPIGPPTTLAPPPPATLPRAAYDLARGAASAVSAGQGGWLPVISSPACPVSAAPVAPSPSPATTAASAVAPAPAGGPPPTKKATATTKAASAPRSDTTVAAAAPETATPAGQPAPASLRAGSTDDNDRWLDYLAYRRKFLATVIPAHDLDIGDRHVIRVLDENGRPVQGARLDVIDEGGAPMVDLRTYADGRSLFFPRLSSNPGARSYRLKVTARNGVTTETTIDRSKAAVPVTLSGANAAVNGQRPPVKLDVQFLIDTTGSMQDEIDRLRTNMLAVSRSIAALPTKPDVRFAMTVYRDCGDAFVSRSYEFDGDVNRFTGELNTVRAAGGGDLPEALNQGLHDAVTRPGWRGDDTVKMVFLVADAAPHLDYANDADYALDTLVAARRGIKIDPIASSGLDDAGEYVFRQLAQLTLGRFVFLTYGADGVSPGDRRPDLNVDAYDTLPLDLLVTRLVQEEVAWQGPDAAPLPPLPPLPSGTANSEPPIVRPSPVPVGVPATVVVPPSTRRPVPKPVPKPTPKPRATKPRPRVTTKTTRRPPTTTTPNCVIVNGERFCKQQQ